MENFVLQWSNHDLPTICVSIFSCQPHHNVGFLKHSCHTARKMENLCPCCTLPPWLCWTFVNGLGTVCSNKTSNRTIFTTIENRSEIQICAPQARWHENSKRVFDTCLEFCWSMFRWLSNVSLNLWHFWVNDHTCHGFWPPSPCWLGCGIRLFFFYHHVVTWDPVMYSSSSRVASTIMKNKSIIPSDHDIAQEYHSRIFVDQAYLVWHGDNAFHSCSWMRVPYFFFRLKEPRG